MMRSMTARDAQSMEDLGMTTHRWLITTMILTCGVFGVGLVQLASQSTPRGTPTNAVVDRFQRTYEVLGDNEVAR